MKIVFIGAGNLASSVAPALQKAGQHIIQIYSRTTASAQQLATILNCDFTTSADSIRQDADIYIYAITDKNYPIDIVGSRQALHLLTSGSVPYTALRGAQHAGIFYPFQTFSKVQPVSNFQDVPILIEASDNQSLLKTEELAHCLSEKIYKSTSESRARLHLAGVLANNFTNCLYALANEQLEKADLPFDILLPLIDETDHKVHLTTQRQAQTGPARRGDTDVMQKQLNLMPQELKEIYTIMSDNIIKNSNKL